MSSAKIKEALKNNIPVLVSLPAAAAIIAFFTVNASHAYFSFCLLSLVYLALLAAYFYVSGKLDTKKAIFLLFAAGVVLRLCYVGITPLGVRQHDIGSFDRSGHAGYITYMYDHMSLPDFDVRTKWQFYQPPFHYTLSALWLKLQTLLGLTYEAACENIQYLTCLYSCITMWISYGIFKQLGLKQGPLVACFAVIVTHPTFIILAGSYNNDMLAVLFAFLTVYLAFRWYRRQTFLNILYLAVAIGLAMSSKLSDWYVAPAVGLLFVLALFQCRNKLRQLAQYVVFGIFCVPMGLFWTVRNYIMYKVPVGYVPRLSDALDQYVGFRSPFSRIFDIFGGLGENIYMCRGEAYGDRFFEYNIPTAVFKTSVFGEWHIGETSVFGGGLFATVLLYTNIALILFSVFAGIYLLCKKKLPVEQNILLYVTWFAVIASFVSFCFKFPHDCTMDFRYIVPSLLVGTAFCGMFLRGCGNKYLRCGIYSLITLFCISSALLYTVIAV